ncbi:AAA family ATPase [Corallococcus llansteffanensis]|uniref:Endonuclease GajA/Old nuclease/RecF-like AAA domain-containing protein n=1 Tax=Corallococcus llansteffanensis TaxID=2316731 RepID=A0A3A8P8A9_9BACT|nr:AAA family ATPase [Corallococcus llansteffanensis]RKH50741.1 hypothetical protein D7V93_30135 [Corallococcus llansteffanensis]
MLTSIKVENFRSFTDSGNIELADINIFVGPNNAGKTTLVSLIELALVSNQVRQKDGPLLLDEQFAFASFDSILSQNTVPGKKRASSFSVSFGWGAEPQQAESTAKQVTTHTAKFNFRKKHSDGSAYVGSASYLAPGEGEIKVDFSSTQPRLVETKPRSGGRYSDVFFRGIFPVIPKEERITKSKNVSKTHVNFKVMGRDINKPTLILRPYRPIPRSVYVLGDPSMIKEDKISIDYLLKIWSGDSPEVKSRIVQNLSMLGLARNLEIKQPRVRGPRVVEVQVATHLTRQKATIADVGFGVSQALPLIAREASLQNGALIAYQPEVHLHPRAQARLADIFVDSAKRKNKSYVETHSEHLILRLQTLIAMGEIAADRVRVFCVEKTNKGSKIRQMQFDENGVPVSKWPKGFLDTSLDLARELMVARGSRKAIS